MFELSRDHEAFRRSVRDFAEGEIRPNLDVWHATKELPVPAVEAMGELGLFGITAPEEFGGADGDFSSLCIAIEEIGRVDQSLGITLQAGVGLGISPIVAFGSREQQERWLPDLVAGRRLAAFGLTEASSGSDAADTSTTARLVDGSWVVDGSKTFITNSGSPITSVVTVTARTGERADGTPEISAVMIPSGTDGFTVEPSYDKLGWHISDTHGLVFSDVRVPESHLLGERGAGFAQFMQTLDGGRVAISALALGLARACLELSVEYAGERTAFGRPVGANQGVAFPLADLDVAVEAARMLTYRAAAVIDAGAPRAEVQRAASRAKVFATEAAVSATRVATQVFGGYGFMEEYPVARLYRDAKVLEVGEGTSEVQRILLARALGLPVR
jgi:short/branched chain acyl-CoA dehydrogenase